MLNSTKTFTSPVSRKSSGITDKLEQESPLFIKHDVNNNTDVNIGTGSKSLATNTGSNECLLSYTIVWSPLPPITWLIPFIGHTGICDSSGIASDFRGPYYVGDDGRMAFGQPTRYYKIDINSCNISRDQWDACIKEANEVYRGRMHNICCDNCHSHVANALNRMPVSAWGIQKWDMVNIAMLMFFRGSFVSWTAILQQFLPFTILIGIIVLINRVV
jgi:transmembrane protein 222